MIFGRPAISTPNRFDLRAVQSAVQAARQRIEILEKAIEQLQATIPVTAVTEIEAQLARLKILIDSLPPGGTSTITIDISNFLQLRAFNRQILPLQQPPNLNDTLQIGSFTRQILPLAAQPDVNQTLFINSFQPRVPTFQSLNSVNPAAIDWILPSQIFGA